MDPPNVPLMCIFIRTGEEHTQMEHEEASVKATNSLMLAQVGQPPPLSVLLGTLALTADVVPSVLSVVVTWKDHSSTWSVVGCTEDVVFQVTATKAVSDWWGGNRTDERGEETYWAEAHHIADLATVSLTAIRRWWNGRDARSESVWHLRFTDSSELTLDPTKGAHAKGHLAENVAMQVRDNWLARR